jgi:hypothetical protein
MTSAMKRAIEADGEGKFFPAFAGLLTVSWPSRLGTVSDRLRNLRTAKLFCDRLLPPRLDELLSESWAAAQAPAFRLWCEVMGVGKAAAMIADCDAVTPGGRTSRKGSM